MSVMEYGRPENLAWWLSAGLRYRFESGPNLVGSREEAQSRGINCICLAHLLLGELFGVRLPSALRCVELFADQAFFCDLAPEEGFRLGDICFFGPEEQYGRLGRFRPRYAGAELRNWHEFPRLHVALVIDGSDQAGSVCLVHACFEQGGVVEWKLEEFLSRRRYGRLYLRKRLKGLSA